MPTFPRFLARTSVLGLTLLLMCTQAAAQATSERPNILWITVEDMSPRLPAYGDSTVSTPHISRLAEEGIVYENAFVVAPVCAPSRASILTGLYPTSFGAQHMRTMRRTSSIDDVTDPELLAIPTYEAVPPPEVKAFTEYLRAAGYYTTNNSKEDYQFTTPVTAWDASSDTAHWRNRPDPEQPFFAVFNFTTTHESRVWRHADDPWLIDTAKVEVPPYYPDTPVIRRDVARHYNNIHVMDGEVGEILQQLEEDGLTDETIIFFYSDHGDGLPRAKRWLYDSGLHVPLIVRFPEGRFPDGQEAGAREDDLVSLIDLPPTMLSLLGLPIPAYMQGQAFLGAAKAAPRRYIYAAKDRMDPALDNARAVRDKRFKYIYNHHPERPFVQFLPYRDQMALMQELHRLNEADELEGPPALWFRETKPPEELYDTAADPHEIRNLAGDSTYTAKLHALRAAFRVWERQTGDLGLIPETTLVKKLWPPDGVQPQTEPVQFAYADSVFSDVVTVTLASPTEGASIAYALNGGTDWKLYTEPIRLTESAMLRAQAIRIGYQHSAVRAVRFAKTE